MVKNSHHIEKMCHKLPKNHQKCTVKPVAPIILVVLESSHHILMRDTWLYLAACLLKEIHELCLILCAFLLLKDHFSSKLLLSVLNQSYEWVVTLFSHPLFKVNHVVYSIWFILQAFRDQSLVLDACLSLIVDLSGCLCDQILQLLYIPILVLFSELLDLGQL